MGVFIQITVLLPPFFNLARNRSRERGRMADNDNSVTIDNYDDDGDAMQIALVRGLVPPRRVRI